MGDDYVLVGSVPCRLSLELHVDGRRVSDQQRVKAGWCIAGHEGTGGTSRKRMRIMSAEGREIIGPRYSYWDRAMLDTVMGYITRQGAKTRSDTDVGHRELVSYPVPKKRERSLHTCAQDVQITRMATI
jgi:hypothetical protein